jgi:predicted nucleic acid-binding protein
MNTRVLQTSRALFQKSSEDMQHGQMLDSLRVVNPFS